MPFSSSGAIFAASANGTHIVTDQDIPNEETKTKAPHFSQTSAVPASDKPRQTSPNAQTILDPRNLTITGTHNEKTRETIANPAKPKPLFWN